LLIQIGRCDPAAFAANDEHVSTCSQDGEELERRKCDKQNDQRTLNCRAALPSILQAMELVE
jgi:hypothetical protein